MCPAAMFFKGHCDLPSLHSFPTRRSSDLFLVPRQTSRSARDRKRLRSRARPHVPARSKRQNTDNRARNWSSDRKSTRLNSSHSSSSYAVFCLKKKNSTATKPTSHLTPHGA